MARKGNGGSAKPNSRVIDLIRWLKATNKAGNQKKSKIYKPNADEKRQNQEVSYSI